MRGGECHQAAAEGSELLPRTAVSNWRRSLKLRYQLGKVLNVVFSQDDSLRMLLLTLTEPNSSWNDFGSAIGRLLSSIGKLMRYKRVQAAVKHSFRALEVTCPRPGEFHPHFHVLLAVPGAYLEPHSPLYITQVERAAMWRKALCADGKRIIDIRVTENHGEVAKYVTKPGGYLELTGEQWQCDDRVLETSHYGLASRRMITRSRSLSPIRKALGFLDSED
jgi:plasmid rolling circle replication initiator protein Rep